MDVLWGFKHYGKSYITGLYRYNRKNVSMMHIGGEYGSLVWKYKGLDQHLIKYFRYNDEDNITTKIRIDRFSSDDLLHHDTNLGIKTQEWVEEDYLGYGNNQHPKPKYVIGVDKSGRKLYPIYADHGSLWEEHFFNDLCDCDLFVPQTHPQLMSYKPFIEHFKTCRNILPYKSDIVDMCIQRINLFESKETNKYMNTSVKDVEDAYYTDKELVFSHLDFFTTRNRDVEQQLIDLEIPYEHLDLDTHDPSILCKKPVPRQHGRVHVPKDSERYEFARRVVDEYIDTRGLTDLRLSGRLHDKI